MKKKIVLWQLSGFIFSASLGVLLHYLYEWTGSDIVALFSAVNESTWEHTKLVFFPMLVFGIIQSFFIGRELAGYWCVKLKGILLGTLLIPVLFYTLNGIFGTTPAWVNIGIFIISVGAAYIYEGLSFIKSDKSCNGRAALCILLLIAVAYGIFTFITPEIPLFADPINGGYGISISR